MSEHDLLAGAIAGKLRLLPAVQRLYPPRPALHRPVRTAGALLGAVAAEPAVVVTGRADALEVEAGIGLDGTVGALEAGRAGIATVLDTLPIGTTARIRLRIVAFE